MRMTGRFLAAAVFAMIFVLNVSAALAYDISGTVSVAGGTTSRVYVVARQNGANLGTSIDTIPAGTGTASFTIRGASTGQYALTAFVDTTATGMMHANDPSAGTSIFVSGANADAGTLAISAPVAVSPAAPGSVSAWTGDGCAAIRGMNPKGGANSLPLAESFNVYWSASPTVSPTNYSGSRTNIPGRDTFMVFLSGLTNGTTYYYVVTSKAGGQESAPSTVQSFTVNPSTIGSTVSGTISYGGTPTGAPLYVILIPKNGGSPSIAAIANPSYPQSYSISGVASGYYELQAVVDRNNNGILDPGDIYPGYTHGPLVQVTGTTNGADATVSEQNSSIALRTGHSPGGTYGLSFEVDSRLKRPVRVTMTGGNSLAGPIDIGVGNNTAVLSSWHAPLSGTPAVNESYGFDLTYADGTTESLSATVSGLISDFASPMTPGGTIQNATPTFTWAAPVPTPSYPYVYWINIYGSDGTSWESYTVPSGQTSLSGFTLTSGVSYTWTVTLADMAHENLTTSAPMSVIYSPAAAAAPAPVPRTGQTSCWDTSGNLLPSCSGTSQDGALQKGTAWPTPRFTVNSSAPDNGGTMTDTLTGLVWSKDANPAGPKTWQDALDYIKTLNSQNYQGYSDWRLPNINELKSIINRQQSDQAAWLNSQGFSNVQADFYWSGSTFAYGTYDAWGVSMGDGGVMGIGKAYGHYVWPVRGGQSGLFGNLIIPRTGQTACYNSTGTIRNCSGTGEDGELQAGVSWPVNRFTDNQNQSVTDTLTGLLWVKTPDISVNMACGSVLGMMTWQQALDYAACLNQNSFLGKNDWRLPNINELLTLSNAGAAYNADWLNSSGFSGIQGAEYWSSTTYPLSTSQALTSFMGFGGMDVVAKSGYAAYAWPVSGGVTSAPSDTIAPSVTTFSIPASSTASTISVSLSGIDNVGVSGYCITRADYAMSCSWSSTAPTSYTFLDTATGVPTGVTLYAFVRDAAGNVSPSKSATISLNLPPTGSISGRVTAFGGQNGMSTVPVRIYNATTNALAATGYTDPGGYYYVGQLVSGSYYILFDGSQYGLVRQYYGGQWSLSTARQVVLAAPAQLSGINADLAEGGMISGQVTSAGGPLAGITVTVYSAATSEVYTMPVTDTSGIYQAIGLPGGGYKVYFNGNASWGGVFYNGKGDLASADVVTVSAPGSASGISAVMGPAPLTLNWGQVEHLTKSDATQIDMLSAGIATTVNTLAGMTLTVAGPNGFSHTFSDSEMFQWLAGYLAVKVEYPSGTLQAGAYTFTLTDANGNKSYRVSTFGIPRAVPLVDSTTIHGERTASGAYRITWAPVNDSSRTWYYRLRVDDSTGKPVYVGKRKADTYDATGSAVPDGIYQIRVEVHEALSGDLTFNRSNSAYVSYTASSTSYDSQARTVTNAGAFNRTDGAGTLGGEAVIYFDAAPSGLTLLELTGPNGFKYTYDLTADKLSSTAYDKRFSSPLVPGSYLFHGLYGTREIYYPATVTAPVTFPAVAPATMQAQYADTAKSTITFSWAPVSQTGLLYYRITVKDSATGTTVYQPSAQQATSMTVSASVIGDPSTRTWRVDTFDSISLFTRRNHFATNPVPLTVQPYGGGLGIAAGRVTSRTMPNGTSDTFFGLNAILPTGGTLTEAKIIGPDSITRDLLKERWYSGLFGGGYLHTEPGQAMPGLYTFVAADSSGNRQIRYKYLPTAHAIASVDAKTVKMNRESNGVRISWAPVASDIPLAYRLSVYALNDLNGDGVMDTVYSATTSVDLNNDGTSETTPVLPVSSVVIPFASLVSTSPLMIGINASDTLSGGSLTNNMSFATVFRYRGVDADYSTITDNDNDGYATDVDPDDTNPAIYPYAPGAVAVTGPLSVATPGGGIYTTTQNVVLSSTAGTTIYFTTDGSAPTYPESATTQVYINPIIVSATTTIRFFARDAQGVIGPERSVSYTIDTAAPETKAAPAGGTYTSGSQTRQIVLASSKPGTIFFTQDGKDPAYPPDSSTRIYVGPVNMSAGGTLKFRSRDLAGNLEVVRTELYSIDAAALIVQATPPGGRYNKDQSVTLAASAAATIYYTTDGVTVPDCSGTGSLYSTALSLATDTTLTYIACGSNGTASGTAAYYFDRTAPAIVSYYPASGASDVPLEAVITMTFSKALPASSFPAPSRMLKIGTTFIPATGGLDASGTTMTIVPGSPLLYGTTYTIAFGTVKDGYGNTLAPFSANFTTLTQPVMAVVPVVSLDASAKSVISGNAVSVSGVVTASAKGVSGQTVALAVTRPDGGIVPLTATSDASGQFSSSLTDVLIQPGRYQVQAFLGASSGTIAPVSSPAVTVTVLPVAGYAIIAQGSVASSEGAASYEKTLYRAKAALLARGFSESNIITIDTTNDKLYRKVDLMDAVIGWAKNKLNAQAAPLHIILADHGDIDKFYVSNHDGVTNADDVLTPAELADWITTLEGSLSAEALAQPRYIVIGSCYSGTFLPSLARAGRVIITSTDASQQSFRGPAEPDGVRSGEYFLDEFYSFLKLGQSIRDAFNNAVDSLTSYARRGGTVAAGTESTLQTPLFSIDGDTSGMTQVVAGVEENAPDTLYLGAGSDSSYNPSNMVPSERSATISSIFIESSATSADVTITGPAGQDAWFEVRAPSVTSQNVASADSKQLLVDLPITVMTETAAGTYVGTYSGFTESGTYTVITHLKDKTSNSAEVATRSITLYKKRNGNRAPGAAELKTPADTSTQRTALAFEWGTASDPDNDAVTYTLLVSRKADMSSPSLVREGLADTFAVISYEDGLLDLATYYWQVKSVDSYGAVTASAIRSFNTDNTNGGISYLTGTVSDSATGNAVSGATVSVGGLTTTSMANGKYLISVLPGSFDTSASASGYTAVSYRGLSATPMKVSRQNFAMTPTVAATAKITTSFDAAKGYLECPATIGLGQLATCTPQAKPGFQLATVDGCSGTLANSVYTTGAVAADCTVTATFGLVSTGKAGDCDNDGTVTIAEVQSAINMFLGLKTVAACVDTSGDNSVSIAEVQKAINSFLGL